MGTQFQQKYREIGFWGKEGKGKGGKLYIKIKIGNFVGTCLGTALIKTWAFGEQDGPHSDTPCFPFPLSFSKSIQ